MMNPRKLFIFFNDADHFWFSCNVILSAVREAFSDNAEINWCKGSGGLNVEDQKKIEESTQTHQTYVYLVSDNMSYERIVKPLAHLPNIVFMIPVYGNMTVEFERWPNLSHILNSKKVILMAASHRQCQQMVLFVKKGLIKKIPYPISDLHFTENTTDTSSATIDLIYSGRITAQKNVIELMRVFIEARELNPMLRLHIAGEFHDRGYHLHGIKIDLDGYKKEFHNLLELSQGGIIYHGFLNQNEIMMLNSTCDYVVSASTYHDEDFGVSVAQSLAQGLIPILSDWGGHPEFTKIISGFTIPVTTNSLKIPTISTKHLFICFQKLKKLEKNDRVRNKKKAYDYLSLSSFKRHFEKIMTEDVSEYQGQAELYLKYANICKSYAPFAEDIPVDRVAYMDIYKSYLKDYLPADIFL